MTNDDPPGQPLFAEVPLRARLKLQMNVISALMIRQLMATYGRGSLGFLWLIVEPIFLVSGVIVLWAYIHPDSGHGIPVASFVISGYVPLTLWRHLSSIPKFMTANVGLLYYRRITIFDVLFARVLIEVAAVSASGIVVFLTLYSIDIVPWVEDAGMLIAGWCLMCWFSASVGFIVAGLSEKSDVVENLIQPIQYLAMPLSGVFFMVSWLPSSVKPIVTYIPLVNIYEMMRTGFFGKKVETHYSISYTIFWCIIATALGLWAVTSSRKTMSIR